MKDYPGIDDDLDDENEEKDEREGRYSFGQAMMDFAEPLINPNDNSEKSINKALNIAMLCWNMAIVECQKDDIVDEIIQGLRKEKKMSDEDLEHFRAISKMMIERHKRMFPDLHKKVKEQFGRGQSRQKHKERTKASDFVKCPVCRSTVKAANLESHLNKAHYRPKIPSVGTLWRFSNAHDAEVMKAMDDEYERMKEGISGLPRVKRSELEDIESKKHREIAKIEGYPAAIRKIASEKERRIKEGEEGSEVSKWAIDLYFDVFYSTIPGFEDYLFGQFYTKERCEKCTVGDKEESQCETGGADCIYDDEWKPFERAYIDRAVDRILAGDNAPEELRVPDDIHKKAIEREEVAKQWREKMGILDD